MSLVKATQKTLVTSNSVSGAAGKGMVAAGAGGILLTVLAGLIPFMGVLGLSIALIILGALIWE